MLKRGEITDQAWQQIEPLLLEYGQSGGQWRDHVTEQADTNCEASYVKQTANG